MLNCHYISKNVYYFINLLLRYDFKTPKKYLPQNGIYLFFEQGETTEINGKTVDRIVRIGTHLVDGRLREHIRQHYGNVHSLGGNKNGCVFRKHLGSALLMKDNPHDQRLPDWITQNGPSFPEVEELVNKVLRNTFTFSCLKVDQVNERLFLEKGLIALLSRHPLGQSSHKWLGRYAVSKNIRKSGLWNNRHLVSEPLDDYGLLRFMDYIIGRQ